MPKIPTYQARGRVTTDVPSVKSNVQTPIPTIAGQLQSTIARYYVAEKKEEAKVKSAEYENESWNELYGIYDKYKNNPYPTDASNGFLKDVEAYKQNFLNTTLANESNFTKKAWLSRFDGNTSSTLLALNKSSRSKLNQKEQEEFDKFGSSLSTRIRLDNSFLATADSEIDNYVLKYTDKFVREEKRKNLFKVKNATILDKQSRIDPVGLLNQLRENPDLYSDVPEEKEAAIKYAQNLIQQGNDKYFDGVINNLIASTPFGQQADVVSSIEPQIKKYFADPKLQIKAMNDAQTAFDKKRKTIIQEGAAEYYINNNAKINQDYQASLTDPTKFKIFSESLNNLYDEQNVPDKYRTYLPNNKILEIKDLIKGATSPDARLQVVKDLKSFYGNSMPYINKQIYKQIGPDVSLAISVNDPELQSLSILGELNDEQKKFVRSKVNDTNLEESLLKTINSNLSSLADVVANQPEGYATYSEFIQTTASSLKNAAMNGILEDKYKSADEAANDLSERFLADYNFTNETFYIPFDVNGKIVNQDVIEAKARVWENKLYWNDIDLEDFNVDLIGSGGKLFTKEETIDFFKKNGEWYMDGNTGIKFGVKEPFGGFTPMTIDNKNIKINFLDYDGEFSSMKDINGNSYVMDMKDIYKFLDAEYMGVQTP